MYFCFCSTGIDSDDWGSRKQHLIGQLIFILQYNNNIQLQPNHGEDPDCSGHCGDSLQLPGDSGVWEPQENQTENSEQVNYQSGEQLLFICCISLQKLSGI